MGSVSPLTKPLGLGQVGWLPRRTLPSGPCQRTTTRCRAGTGAAGAAVNTSRHRRGQRVAEFLGQLIGQFLSEGHFLPPPLPPSPPECLPPLWVAELAVFRRCLFWQPRLRVRRVRACPWARLTTFYRRNASAESRAARMECTRRGRHLGSPFAKVITPTQSAPR